MILEQKRDVWFPCRLEYLDQVPEKPGQTAGTASRSRIDVLLEVLPFSPNRRRPRLIWDLSCGISQIGGYVPGPPHVLTGTLTHLGGRAYLSLIFFRNSGNAVSAPPSTASCGIP
jgi:hypothetical protein